jgi:prepilin-type processing-associated H-X9-DG protein
MPALTHARKKAKGISCVNSLKQVATGFMLYANDFDGFAYGGPEWAVALMPEAVVKPYRDANQLQWVTAPKGQGYIRGENLLFCPQERISNLGEALNYGDSLTSGLIGKTPFRFTTIGTIKNPDQDSPPLPTPFKLYIKPSESILGADSGIIAPASDNKYTYFSGITNNVKDGKRFCHIDMRHLGQANVFMADGHVTAVKGKELKTYYFYNVRGSTHQDEKFTAAIKNQERYELD